jgi:hypothetical protein
MTNSEIAFNSEVNGQFTPNTGVNQNLSYIYIYIYIFHLLSIIFSREDGVGGLHGIPPPPGVANHCRGKPLSLFFPNHQVPSAFKKVSSSCLFFT